MAKKTPTDSTLKEYETNTVWLDYKGLSKLMGISVSGAYRTSKKEGFPEPKKQLSGYMRWNRKEVRGWIKSQLKDKS